MSSNVCTLCTKVKVRKARAGGTELLKDYLVFGRTVTTERGVGRGSPLEKWIVASPRDHVSESPYCGRSHRSADLSLAGGHVTLRSPTPSHYWRLEDL
jgi:hypothetical protein